MFVFILYSLIRALHRSSLCPHLQSDRTLTLVLLHLSSRLDVKLELLSVGLFPLEFSVLRYLGPRFDVFSLTLLIRSPLF